MFGEDVSDDDESEAKVVPTVIPSSTDAVTTEASSSSVSDSSTAEPSTTTAGASLVFSAASMQDLIEVLKDLKNEELTTVVQEQSTSPSALRELPAVLSDLFLTRLPAAVVIPHSDQVHVDTTTHQTTVLYPAVLTDAPPSRIEAENEASSTTQEQQATAPSTVPTPSENKVFPTEFEKLLTTLRDFVAKADALTSTEAPVTAAAPEAPQLQQHLEFVNYTVTAEMKDEGEPKTIVKRSVPEADLNPRFFKAHSSVSKDKGCVFNGSLFKLGEVIKTSNECLKCICEYAPIGHCVLKEKCNA